MLLYLKWTPKPHDHLKIVFQLARHPRDIGAHHYGKDIGSAQLPTPESYTFAWWVQRAAADSQITVLEPTRSAPPTIPRRPHANAATWRWHCRIYNKRVGLVELRFFRDRPDGTWDRKATLCLAYGLAFLLLTAMEHIAEQQGWTFTTNDTSATDFYATHRVATMHPIKPFSRTSPIHPSLRYAQKME